MRSSSIFLFPALGFIVICLIPSVFLLVQRMRQLSRLKHAGVSRATPGCSNCLYIMRGWDSSVCPECGTDAKGTEVRIGVISSKLIKAINALGLALLVILLGLLPLGNWVFEEYTIYKYWTLVSTGTHMFEVHIRASRYHRRFPQKDAVETVLMVESNHKAELDELLSYDKDRIERSMYWDGQGFRVFLLDNADDIPTDKEMADFLGKALEQNASSLNTYATELNNLLKEACKISLGKTSNLQALAPSFKNLNAGSTMRSNLWMPGILLFLLPCVFMIITVPVIVISRHKAGTRPVIDGEWLALASPK